MDSPFSGVLNTNYVPSDDEVTTIKQMVAPRLAILKDLDEQMRALAEERNRQARFIEDHNVLITPIRRLPIDILSYIFLSYLDLCRWRSSYRGKQHPSVLLTHVCRRWRDVGLSNPLLWSTIRIRFPMSPFYLNDGCPQSVVDHLAERWDNMLHKEEAIFTMCLKRSGICPLSLALTASDPSPVSIGFAAVHLQVDETARRRLIAAIHDTSPRWERITLSMPHLNTMKSPLLELLRITPDRAPQLRTLEIACYLPLFDGTTESSCQDFRLFQAEGLRTVKWGVPWEVLSTIPVRWQGLTELYISEGSGASGLLSFTDAIALMEKCPHLIHCTLSLQDSEQDAGVGFPPNPETQPFTFQRKVALPQLQTLGLRSAGVPTGFAAALVLPAIHSISLCGKRYQSQTADDRGSVEFIHIFGDQLQNVALNFASLSHEGFVSCLQSLPVVTRLQLVEGYGDVTQGFTGQEGVQRATLDHATLSGFNPRYDANGFLESQCYCPRLEQFFCNLSGQQSIEGALVEFVELRRNIPDNSRLEIARIKDIGLCFDFSETLNVHRALEETGVVMAGCTLRIRYRGLDREAERQLEHMEDDSLDIYGDVCHDIQLQDYIPECP